MKFIVLILATVLFSGCATHLETFDNDGNASVGIPVPKPRLVKVIKTIHFEAIKGAKNPELCSNTKIEESYDYVTSDEYYYVNFDPSQLAKGAFEIGFNEKGLASKIAVNSEANTGLDSVNSLLGTVLPFYKATKAEELAAASTEAALDDKMAELLVQEKLVPAEDLKAASCITKKTEIQLVPISVK
jgi:hypothetical protein